MNDFGNFFLLFFFSFSLLIFQLGSATIVITETENNEPSLNNENGSASTCYCNCAPVITVSCPSVAPPPSCPTTTDPPTQPPVTNPMTSTTGSTPSTTSSSPSSPVTDPLTTTGSASTVTLTVPITSTTSSFSSSTMSVTFPDTSTSTSSTTSETILPTTDSSSSTISTVTSPTPTMSTDSSSTLTSSISTSTTPVSSSGSTILTSTASSLTSSSTSPSSTTTTQQSSTSTSSGIVSTSPSPKNCSSVLYSDSGWFTSPNYPNDYDNNLACSWLINATDKIVLTFQTFSTELGHDIVSVYNGPTTSSPMILNTSGTTVPSPVFSTGRYLLVTFTTDNVGVDKGFNASYYLISSSSPSTSTSTSTTSTSAPATTTVADGSTKSTLSTDPDFTRPTTSGPILDNCQAILSGDSGSLSSPYYPQNYPNNANCSWIITASGRVIITFHQFATEISSDVLKIYDGPTTNYYRLLAHSGTTIPSPVLSSGSQVLITFNSDGSVNNKGFNASYLVYIPPTTTLPPYYYCGENITDSSGFITSPNFPNGYPAYSRCTWIVQTAPGTRIQFHFTDFSTGSGDYVSVYGSQSCTSYPVIQKSGNVSSICGFVSNGNSLRITFNSGASSSTLYPGFKASFTTDHGCGGTLNSTNQGKIMSPGYDINGTFSYSCGWKLGVSQGSKLNFSVSETMGSAPLMNFYEEYDQNRYQLASGGPVSSYFAVSRSNQVSLEMSFFHTWGQYCLSCSSSCTTNAVCYDAGVNNAKWKGSYSATTGPTYGCHGSMNTETRTVTSPGYPSTYTQRSLTCNWEIKEPAGKKVQLSFPVPISLHLDKYYPWYYDTLTIWSPPSPWTLTIKGGTYNPAPMEIKSNQTSLSFSTYSSIDNSSLYSGWKINWNVLSLP